MGAQLLKVEQDEVKDQKSKELQADNLDRQVQAVSSKAELAKMEQTHAKEKKHLAKDLDELHVRKRTLIQSKLDDLSLARAPFHEAGKDDLDKLEEANKLRERELEKTEAVVKAASSAANAKVTSVKAHALLVHAQE